MITSIYTRICVELSEQLGLDSAERDISKRSTRQKQIRRRSWVSYKIWVRQYWWTHSVRSPVLLSLGSKRLVLHSNRMTIICKLDIRKTRAITNKFIFSHFGTMCTGVSYGEQSRHLQRSLFRRTHQIRDPFWTITTSPKVQRIFGLNLNNRQKKQQTSGKNFLFWFSSKFEEKK